MARIDLACKLLILCVMCDRYSCLLEACSSHGVSRHLSGYTSPSTWKQPCCTMEYLLVRYANYICSMLNHTCLLLLVRCTQCIKYLAVCERPQGEACQVSLPVRVELGRQQIRGHPVFPPGVVFHSLPEVQLDVGTLTLHNETHQASSLRM